MHLLSCPLPILLPLLTLLTLTTASDSTPANKTSTIYHHPPSSTPLPLAILRYNPAFPSSAELLKFTPPKTGPEADTSVTRIGITYGAVERSTAVSVSSFADSLARVLRVVLDAQGDVAGVSLHATASKASASGKKSGGRREGEGVRVEVVRAKMAPVPVLQRAVVKEGNGEGEVEVEKTFFQKYWWLFLAATALAVLGGGGDK